MFTTQVYLKPFSWLAGGPGSGKTFVTRSAFAGTGLKLVNSDAAFERAMKKLVIFKDAR